MGHERAGHAIRAIDRLLPFLQMAGPPLAAHVDKETFTILPKGDDAGRRDRSSQRDLGVNPTIFRLSQLGPLRPSLSQRHRGIFADRQLTLATLQHIAECPAAAAAFDLKLQPLRAKALRWWHPK